MNAPAFVTKNESSVQAVVVDPLILTTEEITREAMAPGKYVSVIIAEMIDLQVAQSPSTLEVKSSQ